MPKPRIFVAGETAPDPLHAYWGSYIPDHAGNVALRILQDTTGVQINRDVHPHVLRLNGAIAQIAFGEIDSEGRFIPGVNKATGEHGTVVGQFIGPGSELKVY